jgi:hypothetical protein
MSGKCLKIEDLVEHPDEIRQNLIGESSPHSKITPL